MSKATLAGWYSSRAWYEPERATSVREILENEDRFLPKTIDMMDRIDAEGTFRGWDMGDLIALANLWDIDFRRQERRQRAAHRLCRIIAGMYTRAVIEGDMDECDRLADALVLATRTWGNC